MCAGMWTMWPAPGIKRQKTIGFGLRTLRVRRLPQVHPVMQRAGMIRVRRDHLLERASISRVSGYGWPSRVQ